MTALVFVLAGVVSCNKYEFPYKSASATGMQVYFPSSLPSLAAVDINTSSYDIVLNRMETTDAVTVPLNVEVKQKHDCRFNIPTQVSFAAGSASAALTLTYDPSLIEYDVMDTLKISISDATMTSEYGPSSYEFVIGAPAPYTYLGQGKIKDNYYFGTEYVGVRIYQNDLDPTIYKVEKPYSSLLGASADGNETDLIFKILKKGDKFTHPQGDIVTITHDGLVYFEDCNTGYYHSTYKADIWLLHIINFSAGASEDSWLNSFVEQGTSDEPEVISLAPFYYMFGVGGWNYSSTQDAVTIVMPGCVYSDYNASVTYNGKVVDPKDNTSVVAKVSLGKDVARANVAMVPGGLASVSDEVYNQIVDGSYNPLQKIEKSGEVYFDASEMESGDYAFVVVTFDEEGNLKKDDGVDFLYKLASATEEWNAIATGEFTYSQFFTNEDESPYVEEGMTLYQSSVDGTRFKIGDWGYSEGDDFPPLYFSFDGFGNVLVEKQETGFVSSYGTVYVEDCVTKYGSTQYGVSSFDAEDQTFTFSMVYYCSQGVFARGPETFVITGEASDVISKARRQAMTVQSLELEKTSRMYSPIERIFPVR